MISAYLVSLSLSSLKETAPWMVKCSNTIVKRYFRLMLPTSFILLVVGLSYCLGLFDSREEYIKY